MALEYELPPYDLLDNYNDIKFLLLQGSPGEQDLVQSLINEQIQIYGTEVYYLPRKILKLMI